MTEAFSGMLLSQIPSSIWFVSHQANPFREELFNSSARLLRRLQCILYCSVSNIANRCFLLSACCDGSLKKTSNWQRMKRRCLYCISVPLILHLSYISRGQTQAQSLCASVPPEMELTRQHLLHDF